MSLGADNKYKHNSWIMSSTIVIIIIKEYVGFLILLNLC